MNDSNNKWYEWLHGTCFCKRHDTGDRREGEPAQRVIPRDHYRMVAHVKTGRYLR